MPLADEDLAGGWTELLEDLGDDAFYTINKTAPPIDPDTGLPTGPTVETREKFFGAMVEYSNAFNANSNIQSGDKKLIAEHAANIQINAVIEDYNGDLWAIVDPNEINPTGVTQVYELHIRKQ